MFAKIAENLIQLPRFLLLLDITCLNQQGKD